MEAAVDEILVDLFASLDGDIRQETVSLSREAKLSIALEVFQKRGWAERTTDEGDQLHWRTTAALISEMEDAAAMLKPVHLTFRPLVAKNDSAKEYRRCVAIAIQWHSDLALWKISADLGLRSRGLMERRCSDDLRVNWVLTPKGIFVGYDDKSNIAKIFRPIYLELEKRHLMARRIGLKGCVSWWPTAEGLALGLGDVTGNGYELAERLLGVEPGSLRKTRHKQKQKTF